MPQPSYSGANGYIAETYFTIFFSIPLDPAHPPNLSAFEAQINGTDATIASIEINTADNSIKITFASATLLPGDIIDFVYTDPTVGDDVNAVQGLDGTDAASFSHSIVVAIARPGPSAPATPTLDPASDTGTLGDFITKDTTPTVNGTAEANATIKLYDTDGSTLLGTTTADGAGKWSLSSNTLSQGSHTLKVTQTNGMNQTSSLSNGLTLSIDTVANPPGSMSVVAGSDSGTLGDGISNVSTPQIKGVAEAFASVTLYDTDGSTVLGTGSADKAGNWSITTSNLSPGVHTLTSKQTDLAGNDSAASTGFSYTLDTVGPIGMSLSNNSIPIASATNGSTVASLKSTDITSVTYGFAVGNGIIDADNGKFVISGDSLKAAQNLSAGTYHIYLSGTDAAGNDAFQIFTFTVTNAPSVSTIVRAGGASSTVLANASSVDYTVTFSENVTGVDSSDFALNKSGSASGAISNVTGSGSTYTVTVNNLSGDGTLRLDLNSSGTGIKNSGSVDIKSGFTAGQTYTLDHTAPTTTTSYVSFSNDGGSSKTDFITSSSAQTISGTLSANLASDELVQVSLDNGVSWVNAVATVGNNTFTLSGQSLTSSNTLKVRVSDAAGNNGTASSQAYVLDTKAPTLNVVIDDTDLRLNETSKVTFTFSEAITGFSNSSISLSNSTLSAVSSSDGGITWTATLTPDAKTKASGNALSIDMSSISDIAGNNGVGSTKSSSYSVDTTNTAPTITGATAGQTTLDSGSVSPFSSVAITDPDPGAIETVTVKLDSALKGYFTTDSLNATGFFSKDGGSSYTHLADTPANVEAALRGLVFQPSSGRTAVNSNEVTTFTISVSDGIASTVSDSKTTVISTATNKAPTGVTLSASQLEQASTKNTVVGNLSSIDINPGDSFTYQLVQGDGNNDRDNALFIVSGNQLIALNPGLMNPGEYRVFVRSTDSQSESVTQSLMIQVVDNALPLINGIYLIDPPTVNRSQVSFLLKFNKPVFGIDASDFIVATTGTASGVIASISQDSNTNWVVVLNQLSGDGTIGLNLKGSDTGIVDAHNQSLQNNGFVGQRYRLDPGFFETTPESDNDRDNISRSVELGVPNLNGNGRGDGNGDGILDDTQTYVSSLTWLNGQARDHYLTLSNDQKLSQTQITPLISPLQAPANVKLDYGVLSVISEGVAKGGTVDFTLFSDRVAEVNGVWLRDKEGNWTQIKAQVVEFNGRIKMSFSVQEGSLFDLDGQSNSSLTLNIAPGFKQTVQVTSLADQDGDKIPDLVESKVGTNPAVKDNLVSLRNDLFVMQLYRDILYREADSAGLGYWQNQLDNGQIDRTQAAVSIMRSAEFQQISGLARLAYGTFAEVPSRDLLAYMLMEQKNGASLAQIASEFLSSSEMQAQVSSLDSSQFVSYLYHSILQREADTAGLAYWSERLGHGMNRGELLASFVESPEFVQRTQHQLSVYLDYLSLHGQLPDQLRLTQLINQNLDQVSLVGLLMNEADYINRFTG